VDASATLRDGPFGCGRAVARAATIGAASPRHRHRVTVTGVTVTVTVTAYLDGP
jgi:hypothetical protein